MTTPRVKRPFAGAASDPAQRQITTFFSRDENEASAAAAGRPSPREPDTPRLSASVQANLLTVGMRVRKSVPEGYKTVKDDDDPWAAASHGAAQPSSLPWSPAAAAAAAAATTSPRADRELVPFCGLHKVGGLGVQSVGDDADRPLFASSLFSGTDGAMSEPPSLTSSQETVSSMASSGSSSSRSYGTANVFAPSGSRRPSQYYRLSSPRWEATKTSMRNKRMYDEDEDEDEDEDDLDGDNTVGTDADHTRRVYETGGEAPYRSFTPASSINGWLAGSASASMLPSSPSQPPSHHTSTPHYFQNGRRVLAVPRRRQQPQQPQQQQESFQLGARCRPGQLMQDQENMDFDEADFLDAAALDDVRSGAADMQMGGM